MQTPCHIEVGESLRGEQQYLCCYCESEITLADSHIEHMAPRSAAPALAYEYSNLACSCNGGIVEHCGRFKDDRHHNPAYRYDAPRFVRPHDPATRPWFRYLPDGTVVPAPGLNEQDYAKAEYMIGYLGLNCSRLCGRRHGHAQAIIQTLGPSPDIALIQRLTNYWLTPNAAGKLKSFFSLSETVLT
ncbi:MAG: TIGR02646 family protein [Elusimicrobia bacterium]|nr:TIGR02646 family protein [Elusimicrobiota bacterium]